MKKIKFGFWLLGLGCGMSLTGIIATLTTLHVSVQMPVQPVAQDESEPPVLEKNQAPIVVETKEKEVVLTEHEAPAAVEVIIPEAMGAEGICHLLEAAGIVDRADNFLDYVRQCNVQNRLKSGKLILSTTLSYKELLAELTY